MVSEDGLHANAHSGRVVALRRDRIYPMELIERHTMPPKKFKFVEAPPSGPVPKVRAMGVDVARGLGEDATVYAYFDVWGESAGDELSRPDEQLPFKRSYDEDLMSTA